MARLVLTGLAGTSIEWFDFYLYGVASALVFPTLYFAPGLPPLVALFASFSTFAVGFFARPVGAALFGHLGDRAGRKAALAAALVLMGSATALIGCLPGYAVLGAWAPALLVVLRFLQGLAIGGQWGGAMLLVVENAPPARRGFYGSFTQVGAPAGVVAANLAFLLATALTTPAGFLAVGWRVPFWLSIGLVGLAYYVHRRVEETPEFRALKAARDARLATMPAAAVPAARSPLVEALCSHPRQILLAAGAFLAVQVSFYLSITFVVAYGASRDYLALSKSTMLACVLVASAATAPALVLFGALSDRFGRLRLYMAGSALMAAWAFAFFPLIDTRSPVLITLAICVTQAINGMMYGPQAALFAEMFQTRVRYSGASLGYQLGSAVGGAVAPSVATAILATYHGTFGISVYMAGACLVTLLCVAGLRPAREAVA
ncbi:MAG: MHS family MFS transporter [Proteobacteria bacterium]|nr:MHS family MFS transporter [Pseudomonadota bacterium]